jgi:hypothetical protein
MSKKGKVKKITCKNCGESWLPHDVPTNKEWTKMAPLPDKEGRVTIMIMATWSCPGCGKTRMGLKGKFKGDEPTGPSKKEMLIEKIEKTDDRISIADLATEFSFSPENLEKALLAFIKRGTISGKIEAGYFIKE